MRSGYLYVLVHPSDPDLYKIGVTILDPMVRLAQHNRDLDRAAGRVVQATGQPWVLKTCLQVPDPYWAEKAFWAATTLADVPLVGGVEVQRLEWASVERGLTAVRQAGVRPHVESHEDHVYAYTEWMRRRLVGRGLTLLGVVRSKLGKADFECAAGHRWRTKPEEVAGGDGCPVCGIGKGDATLIERAAGGGVISLLIHPGHPGVVRIERTQESLRAAASSEHWGEWQLHRYRRVDDVELAESLLWVLLGRSKPTEPAPVTVSLETAEAAMRALIFELSHEIALRYKMRSH